MTQTTQCGFCREYYQIGDQTYTSDAEAAPLNQCATCARQEARSVREREYPIFDWRPEDRVELVDWQPSDLVWLASDA